MSAEENLKKLGLTLPNVPTPVANYVPWKRDGNTIYLSGQGPRNPEGGGYRVGKVGKDVTDRAGLRARQAHGPRSAGGRAAGRGRPRSTRSRC